MRVDVAPPRRRLLELLPQLAHEHVDRAVAARHRVAPHPLVDLLALQHPPLGRRQQLDQLELAAGELDRPPPDQRLELIGPDLDLPRGPRPPPPPPPPPPAPAGPPPHPPRDPPPGAGPGPP